MASAQIAGSAVTCAVIRCGLNPSLIYEHIVSAAIHSSSQVSLPWPLADAWGEPPLFFRYRANSKEQYCARSLIALPAVPAFTLSDGQKSHTHCSASHLKANSLSLNGSLEELFSRKSGIVIHRWDQPWTVLFTCS